MSQYQLDIDIIEAVKAAKVDKVKRLLSQGANPNAEDEKGNNALRCAILNTPRPGRQMAFAEIMEEEETGVYNPTDPDGYKKCLQVLLEEGADPDLPHPVSKRTALMEATKSCDDCAKILLEHGADPDLQDEAGKTALMEAAQLGGGKTAKMLIEAGADLHLLDENRQDASYWAAKFSKINVFKLIIDAKEEEREHGRIQKKVVEKRKISIRRQQTHHHKNLRTYLRRPKGNNRGL